MPVFVRSSCNNIDENPEAGASHMSQSHLPDYGFLLHLRRDFTRYSASEAEELENLDGVGAFLSENGSLDGPLMPSPEVMKAGGSR